MSPPTAPVHAAYRSKRGRIGTIHCERAEDARRIAERVVKSWDERDSIVELRFGGPKFAEAAAAKWRKAPVLT